MIAGHAPNREAKECPDLALAFERLTVRRRLMGIQTPRNTFSMEEDPY
jgi:hypothetical protein